MTLKINSKNKPIAYSYIRFSTSEQSKGDSLRRQIKLSEDYAVQNNLELDKSLNLRDLGVSAFKGDNKDKGALSHFLKLVKEKKIQKGAFLIVESLDRLSRAQTLDALNLFTEIINHGITIVTLADNKEYSVESINNNFADLMFSLMMMSRAHEESLIKSKRVGAAWKNKREQIQEKKLTGKCPAWLKLSEDKTEFIKIKDKCDVIVQIFEMYSSGKGMYAIEKELNESKTIKWHTKNGWRKSYIQKILRNRAVIGEFQPFRLINKKRVPAGDVIQDYFPKLISDDLFLSVQEKLGRNQFYGGKNGRISNLFGCIAKCGYCGSSMQFVNKGKKSGTFLVCDNVRRGRGCFKSSVNYEDLEKAILSYTKGLNVKDIIDRNGRNKDLTALEAGLLKVQDELGKLEIEIKNLTNLVINTSDKRVQEHLQSELSTRFDAKEQHEKEKNEIKSRLNKIKREEQDISKRLQSIEELYRFMNESTGEEVSQIRFKLRDTLRSLIKSISIFPLGRTKFTSENVHFRVESILKARPELAGTKELEEIKRKLITPSGDKESCEVSLFFQDGNERRLRLYQDLTLIHETDVEENIAYDFFWSQNIPGQLDVDIYELDPDKSKESSKKTGKRKSRTDISQNL
jgi:DNA invertase Pin-like site-specific DNA recombinase